jgi:hypothetical protein
MPARAEESLQESFARALEAMLAADATSDELWQVLRTFVARHKVEAFRRAQDNGVHLLPVHTYSPVPDTRSLTDLDFRERDDFLTRAGVDVAAMLEFVASAARWAGETDDIPAEPPPVDAFYWENTFFGELDALTYYGVLRERSPRLVVEIGGGYSTLLAARAAALNAATELVCIDPHPPAFLKADVSGLSRLLPVPVQRLPPEFFDDLGSDDVLFVDSSHVSKIGSDVNYLVLDVLPRLREGVLVHFHDIFLPSEYPRAWVEGLAFLNEQYLLAAFLLANDRFDVLAANHHLSRAEQAALEQLFGRSFQPQPRVEPSSLWMRVGRAATAAQ